MNDLNLSNLAELSKNESLTINGGSDLTDDIWYGIGWFSKKFWRWSLESHPTYGY